jgi:hypothetical protein
MTGIVIEEFRHISKGSLRGFCRARFPSGLIVDEIGIHLAAENGRAWASPPGRPMVDAEGRVMRDERGKVRYAGLITFSTSLIRNQWSDLVVAAVRAKYPDALT